MDRTPEDGGEIVKLSQHGGQRRRGRKLRRGRGGKSRRSHGSLVILHSNIRGYNSKRESLEKVVKDIDADVCTLNETGLRGKNKVVLPGYISFTRNRVAKAMGGISTSVKDTLKDNVVHVGEGEGDDEFLVIRLDNFTPPICILNCYGEQEGRSGKELVETKWAKLKHELDKIKGRGEECIFLGDLNKLIGNDELGVHGNHSEISFGGKLVRELLATEDYILVNNMPVATGGPFTRIDPADPNKKSCLDLAICSAGLRPYIESLIIDSKREHAMKRAICKRGKFCVTYSDHFSFILRLRNLPRSNVKTEKITRWNLRKEGGWARYKELAEEQSMKLINIIEDESKTIEEVVKGFERINDNIKFDAFGKVTLKGKNTFRSKQKAKEVNEEEEARELLRKQTEKAEEELTKLKENSKGSANVFKIVQAIQGPKKGGSMDAYSITDPETGKLAVSGKEIKRISLEYCKEVLTNNEAVGDSKQVVHMKASMHSDRMMQVQEGSFLPSKEGFMRVIKKFKQNDKRNYDFLIKTGSKFKEAVFRLCSKMITEEQFPRSFDNTTLHQIFKGKGKREVLSNNRYIHSKDWLPRTVESMVVDNMKETILRGSSPYQIGGQPKHRPQEHIFSVKSMMAKYNMEGKVLLLQAYDISKFFDKEVVEDVMDTLYNMGVDMKAYRVWTKLNMNTRIRVKTGAGYTEWSDEGSMIGQGTGGGALVSQANLDKGIMDMFSGSVDEIGYGSVRVLPLMFQDDIMRVAGSVFSARAGNVKVAAVMRSKQLCLNPDKTGYIILGKRGAVEKVRSEIEKVPIMCGDFITKEKVCDKWLGDMFHQDGLAASVVATIKERQPKVKGALYEAAAIVDDWRAQCIGGFRSALDLWELAILPTLLYNSEMWVDIPRVAEETLEDLQLFFVRLILRVPQGTPKAALRSETGLLSMKLRIWKRKCLLLHHIKNMGEETLAKQVYLEQRVNDWPGLSKEVTLICKELGIEDVNSSRTQKNALRKELEKACRVMDEKELKEKMGKKMMKLKSEDCQRKGYMDLKSLADVRSIFRVRTNMVEGFRGSFQNMYENTSLNCEGCGLVVDYQAHSMECPAYDDLREGLDMDKDLDLVTFFRKVMDRRNEE
jgi:hypothetical protein